jgi:hypothetical protein
MLCSRNTTLLGGFERDLRFHPMMTGMRILNRLMFGGAGISLWFARIPISIVGTPKHHPGVSKNEAPTTTSPFFDGISCRKNLQPYWLDKSQGGIHHVFGFSLVPNLNILIF